MCQLGWWFQNKRTALPLAALKGDDTTKALENAKLDGQAVKAGLDEKGVQAGAPDHSASQRPNDSAAIGDENDRWRKKFTIRIITVQAYAHVSRCACGNIITLNFKDLNIYKHIQHGYTYHEYVTYFLQNLERI